MTVMSDRDATIEAMITARAWRDREYLDELVRNPREVLADEGMQFPADVELRVVVNTDTVRYVHFTDGTTKSEIVAVIADLVPLTDDRELRIVQSTDTVEYLVIAAPPAGLDIDTLSETQLIYTVPVNDTVKVVNYVAAVNVYAESQAAVTTTAAAAEVAVVAVIGLVFT
jgi:hypothetical protein